MLVLDRVVVEVAIFNVLVVAGIRLDVAEVFDVFLTVLLNEVPLLMAEVLEMVRLED